MKKRWAVPVLCAVLLLGVFSTALAEEPAPSGFYGVGSAQFVEIVPVDASGKAVEAVTWNMDGRRESTVFYPGSTALRITLLGAVPGRTYLLTVAGSDGILYADQQTAGLTAEFLASFRLPEAPAELTLRIGSDAAGFTKLEIPLSYTPSAEGSEASPFSWRRPSSYPEPELPPEPDPEPAPEAETKPGYAECARGAECPLAAYSDLDAASWYHDGVHWALDHGVMKGVDGEHFAPGTAASRAMVVTMLWRLEGEPESDHTVSFLDVAEGSWYAEAVSWAASKHVVDGYGEGLFGPNDGVSREQLATILWRFSEAKGGGDRLPAEPADLSVFQDVSQISGWAYEAMEWAVGTGLVTGVGDGRLSPKTEAGRAQVATILMRYEKLGSAAETE